MLTSDDEIIWRTDFTKKMGVTTNTVRRWIRDGKVPPPDIDLSLKIQGWRTSTLHKAGINIPPCRA
ncbi:hypothetical protein GCM10027182_05390 [Aquaspirillum soli]